MRHNYETAPSSGNVVHVELCVVSFIITFIGRMWPIRKLDPSVGVPDLKPVLSFICNVRVTVELTRRDIRNKASPSGDWHSFIFRRSRVQVLARMLAMLFLHRYPQPLLTYRKISLSSRTFPSTSFPIHHLQIVLPKQ
jgi:hypothetical protein